MSVDHSALLAVSMTCSLSVTHRIVVGYTNPYERLFTYILILEE